MATSLALYDAARSALAKAARIDEARKVRDAAEQLKLYARQANDRQFMIKAAMLQLRAERRLGEIILSASAIGQIRRGRPWPDRSSDGLNTKNNSPEKGQLPRLTLERAGINRKLAEKARELARLPSATFMGLLEETRDRILAGGARLLNPQSEILIRDRKKLRRDEVRRLSENPMLLPEGPFAGGVLDPPWKDPNRPIGFNPRHYEFHYPLMSVEEICGLKCPVTGRHVSAIFGKKSAILLWCTAYHIAIGSHVKVLEALGFTPSTELIWYKKRRGLGRGFAVNVHESLILGLRGDFPAPDDENRPLSLFEIARTRIHSQKPDWPERQLERWLPGGAFVSMFHRGAPRKDWVAWGYNAEPTS